MSSPVDIEHIKKLQDTVVTMRQHAAKMYKTFLMMECQAQTASLVNIYLFLQYC